MEKNKSIDGLTTHAAKKSHTTAIDGLKTRSMQPAIKTAAQKKQQAKKPKMKATLVKTTDEDLLSAFSEEPVISEKNLKAVNASFVEQNDSFDYTNEALDKALSESFPTDDEPEKESEQIEGIEEHEFAPGETEDNEATEEVSEEEITTDELKEEKPMSKKELKKKAKEEKALKKSKKDANAEFIGEEASGKKKKKVSKARRIITTILLLIVVGVIGVVSWVLIWGNDIIAKITGGRGGIFDAIGVLMSGDKYDPLKTDANNRTNILAFGTSGWNMEGDEGNGVHAGAQLTDSIMAISLNQTTGDIAMISLPRDLKASPTCTATGKINEVYWCNNMYGDNEEAGAQALMNEVGGILGMDFQYYVHINWGSLVSIVNTLGGIKVTLDESIADYGWTNAVFEAGIEYTIDGEQALGLARARHGTALGDFTRGNSQQKILIGIKNRIYEKNISFTDALSLVSSLGDNLRTSLSVSEIKTAIHLTFEFDFDQMRQLSLMDYDNGAVFMTFANINGISYVIPSAGAGNYTAIQNFVSNNLNNDPVVREKAKILVLNGSGQPGAAAAEKEELVSDEYNVAHIDNTPEGIKYPEDYYIHIINNKMVGTIDALEKKYHTVAIEGAPEGVDASGYDIVLIVGGTVEENPEEAPAEEVVE